MSSHVSGTGSSSEGSGHPMGRITGGRALGYGLALLLIAVLLFGAIQTISSYARPSIDLRSLTKEGTAIASQCEEHGPVTRQGFGPRYSCELDITWDDGSTENVTTQMGLEFTPDDIDQARPVGFSPGSEGTSGRADTTADALVRTDLTSHGWVIVLQIPLWIALVGAALFGVVMTLSCAGLAKRNGWTRRAP